MRFLLDVNLLIALIDSAHIASDTAHDWFAREGRHSWATCSITELGALRIVGGSTYINSAGSPAKVAPALKSLLGQGDHLFWPDELSLVNSPIVDEAALLTSKQITDTHLLALAVRHGGVLATLDRRLSPKAVKGGQKALRLVS